MVVTKTTHRFSELSDAAKQRALGDALSYLDFDMSAEIDHFTKEGKAHGYDIDDVRYSVSHGQGDGAAWQGRVNLCQFLDHYLNEFNPDHARYVVLREILRDGWLDDTAEIIYNRNFYNNSSIMEITGVGLGALWDIAEGHGDDGAVIGCESVLQGALVRDLAKAIDFEDLLEKLSIWVQEKARDYADDIYRALCSEYEHMSSAEYFDELAEINEWRFDASGKLV